MDDPDVDRSIPVRKPFGRHSRLRTHAQFDYVRKQGVKCAASRLVVSIADPPDDRRRLAIIVSRRYSNKAVVRNRARRLLREAYRQLLPWLKPAWMVILPRQKMKGAKLQDVLPELRKSIDRLAGFDAPDRQGTEKD